MSDTYRIEYESVAFEASSAEEAVRLYDKFFSGQDGGNAERERAQKMYAAFKRQADREAQHFGTTD